MKPKIETVDQAELSIFKKKLKKLAEYKGSGTQLISLYLPENVDRSSVMNQLTEEVSQSSNIKSPQTRKAVQGALKRIINFLKQIDFKLPKNGLVVFCGNISTTPGKTDIKLFTLKPVKDLKVKLYWCDSEFHLAPLKEMVVPTEVYALVVLDKREASLALLKGKRYDVLGVFHSQVAGKTRAGGQSAARFERLREEAEHDFYKRVSEKMNATFLPLGDKLKGVIVGGPGATKNYFLNTGLLDHRLKNNIIATIDTSYTDESGIRELVQKSEETLKDTELMRERKVLNEFMGEIGKDGLAAYGPKEVEEALTLGKAKTLLISEGVEWMVYKFRCDRCGEEELKIVQEPEKFEAGAYRCRKCKSPVELLEEIDYADYLLEKAQATGAEVSVISTETNEGEQFLKGFGGVGALLRFK
jgi:peptide chain release factor subunit 1